MTRKRWAAVALSLLACGLALVVGTVALIDPFEIYRKAEAFIPPIESGTQNYSNAGIAKSYDYDGVIVGSSMTENFRPSQLDALLGGRFVKLPINGGSPYNHRQMLELAFATHDVARVVYGVDVEALTYFYTSPKTEMPEYLYDDDLLNDVYYWFNKSVLGHFVPACLRTLGQTDPDQRDTMYMWGDLYPYGREAVLRDVTLGCGPVEQAARPETPELSQQSRLNVEYNILPFLDAHPETEFTFFFPPYSLVRWYEYYAAGTLGYHLRQKEALVAALLPYENARVFDFQAELGWIGDLSNYIDPGHYGPWINDAMIEAIASGRRRVTALSDVYENDDLLLERAGALALSDEWID